MTRTNYLRCLVYGAALALPVWCQNGNSRWELATDAAMASQSYEQHLLRATGKYRAGPLKLFGFIDMYGKGNNTAYGELHGRVRSGGFLDGEIEFEKASSAPSAFRFGGIKTLPTPQSMEATVKILPLTISSDGKALPEGQLGTFMATPFPFGSTLENWTDYTIPYRGKDRIVSEFRLSRRIKGPLSATGFAAYNVNAPKWSFRYGISYRIR